MKGGHFSPGQAYVAFSKDITKHTIYVTFNRNAIKSSDKVHEEMSRLNTKLLVQAVPNL